MKRPEEAIKPTTKTTLYLPEQLHSEVKIEAAKRRIPMTKLIIQAIEHELERLNNGKRPSE
jgi:predicted HicB family RNase H-like nuclease